MSTSRTNRFSERGSRTGRKCGVDRHARSAISPVCEIWRFGAAHANGCVVRWPRAWYAARPPRVPNSTCSTHFASRVSPPPSTDCIIVATVVVFIVQFRPGAQGRTGSIKQECAAEVRGKCIEPKEYQAELMLVAPGRMIEASQMRALGIA